MMEEDADFIFALTKFALVHSILSGSYLKLVNLEDNLHQLFNQLTVTGSHHYATPTRHLSFHLIHNSLAVTYKLSHTKMKGD